MKCRCLQAGQVRGLSNEIRFVEPGDIVDVNPDALGGIPAHVEVIDDAPVKEPKKESTKAAKAKEAQEKVDAEKDEVI